MKLNHLSPSYDSFTVQRKQDLENDLQKSNYTTDLFKQYKKHLGAIRYFILIEGQKLIVPERVGKLLGISKWSLLTFFLPFYKLAKRLRVNNFFKNTILPKKYRQEIYGLDIQD
jgi:hypothetical protein